MSAISLYLLKTIEMRLLLFAIVLVTVISCKDGTNQKIIETTVKTIDSSTANDEWIEDFKKFRDAVYQNDKIIIKDYFNFPIQGNDIWTLVFWKEPDLEKVQDIREYPFTENDFDKRISNVFPKYFIKALLKVKTDSLLLKSEYETIRIHENDSFSYRIISTVENNKTLLRLFYNYEIIHRDENGEVLDGGEASIIYLFDIIDKKKIRFKGLEFAG